MEHPNWRIAFCYSCAVGMLLVALMGIASWQTADDSSAEIAALRDQCEIYRMEVDRMAIRANFATDRNGVLLKDRAGNITSADTGEVVVSGAVEWTPSAPESSGTQVRVDPDGRITITRL